MSVPTIKKSVPSAKKLTEGKEYKKMPAKVAAKTTKVAAKTPSKSIAEYTPFKERLTKTSLVTQLMQNENAPSKKQVQGILADLEQLMLGSIHQKGAGEFMLPGLFKITTKVIPPRKMPAIKGGEKKPNPFKPGEFLITKARDAFTKPASVRVKIRPMKKLKDACNAK